MAENDQTLPLARMDEIGDIAGETIAPATSADVAGALTYAMRHKVAGLLTWKRDSEADTGAGRRRDREAPRDGRDPDDPQTYTLKMAELQFKHLRHTAITRLAEAECEQKLISAISGHTPGSIDTIIERYLVRTGGMARAAFAQRMAHDARQAKQGKKA